jgi:HEAT repeats/PBS lyase HEAT-like repeat
MKHLVIALALSVSAIALSGQQPHVSNTQFNTEPAGAGLSATVDRFRHSSQQLWIGYEVPAQPRRHEASCSDLSGASTSDDGCCGEYRLERSDDSITNASQHSDPGNVYVLIRLDHGDITKVQPVMAGCHLNAGGIPFTWLTGVQPDDSARYLGQLAQQATTNRLMEGALAALAQHATPTATTVLASLATPSNTSAKLREQSAFWLGAERGHDGLVALRKLTKEEPDPKLREKLAFDISINSDPSATDELLTLAKSDSNSQVRSQAIFWLAQKAGKKASAAITDAIENDPDIQVKKKAVFALSQLPADEGIPQLIHVADTSREPELRKQAMFWLGQSKDPRALEYIEAVLKR